MARAGSLLGGLASAEPERQGPHLNADARRHLRPTQWIVECDVRHAMCALRIAVVRFEHERLLSRHVGKPVPPVRGMMRNHQALERPFGLVARIKYGISFDQVFGGDAAGVADSQRHVLWRRRYGAPDV